MPAADSHDPISDGAAVHACVAGGGVAVFKVDVGYAIVGHTESAIRRIYTAKQRSYDKPCGMFASLAIFDEIVVKAKLHPKAEAFARAVMLDHGFPLSIVAPFRTDHPFLRNVAPFVLAHASKAGTMDLLMNAGPTHDALAAQALATMTPVFGSSANRSLTGSKFQFADVEPEVLAAADLVLDRGATKYSNGNGLGSTIIDLERMVPVRIGVVFPAIRAIAAERFGVEIPTQVA